jgi:hypothetical protein
MAIVRITLFVAFIISGLSLKGQTVRPLKLSQAPARVLSLDSTFLFITHDKKDVKIDHYDVLGNPVDSWGAQILNNRNSPKVDDRGLYPKRYPLKVIASDSSIYLVDLSNRTNIQVLHLTPGGKVDSAMAPTARKNRRIHFYYAHPSISGLTILFTEQELGYHNRFKKEKIFWYEYLADEKIIKLDSMEMPKIPRPSAFNYWRIAGYHNSNTLLYTTDYRLKSKNKPETWFYQIGALKRHLRVDSVCVIKVNTPEKMRMNGKTNPRTGGFLKLSPDGSKILFSGIYGKNSEVFKNKVVKVALFSITGDSLWERTIELPDEPWLGAAGYHNINQPLVYLNTQFNHDTVILTVKDDHRWATWKINHEGKILCHQFQFWEDLKPWVKPPTSNDLIYLYNTHNQKLENITDILNSPSEEQIGFNIMSHLFYGSTHYFVFETEEKGWSINAVQEQCPINTARDD